MNLDNTKWLARHLNLAAEISRWSKDNSTKVGALIVTKEGKPVSWGYNGIPMGVRETMDRDIKPEKYHYYAHAERNALDLSRSSVGGCWLFVTHPPCSDCARGIIQTGISTVVIDTNGIDEFAMRDNWSESAEHALTMFNEANIKVIYFDPIKHHRVEHALARRITKKENIECS